MPGPRSGGSPWGQSAADLRFDWGLAGAESISLGAKAVVVVDVLSFTTTLSVAADRGIEVFPYAFDDASAEEFAAAKGAVLAQGRSKGGLTLSPASIRSAQASVTRLVLPSPNGSAISAALAKLRVPVIGACLRNAGAVAQKLGSVSGPVAVVAAGERWPDGGLRPSVEHLWGAGAVLSGMVGAGNAGRVASAEAEGAIAAFRELVRGFAGSSSPARAVAAGLVRCGSGQELIAAGFPQDVEIAGELDQSDAVPVLRGDSFLAS